MLSKAKLDLVSFDDKNLRRRRKLVGERDFLIRNSYTDQVQCLLTSLVQPANQTHVRHFFRIQSCLQEVLKIGKEKYGNYILSSCYTVSLAL